MRKAKSRPLLVGVALACTLGILPLTGVADAQQRSAVISEDVAYKLFSTITLNPRNPAQPRKWKRDELRIGFRFQGDSSGELKRELIQDFEPFRRKLEQETGMNVFSGGWSDEPPVANMFVLLGNAQQLIEGTKRLAEQTQDNGLIKTVKDDVSAGRKTCTTLLFSDEFAEIQFATIIVNTEGDVSKCVEREVLRGFGLANNIDTKEGSLLGPNVEDAEIQEIYWSILYALYHAEDLPEAVNMMMGRLNADRP